MTGAFNVWLTFLRKETHLLKLHHSVSAVAEVPHKIGAWGDDHKPEHMEDGRFILLAGPRASLRLVMWNLWVNCAVLSLQADRRNALPHFTMSH